ncbi:hypothetical protein U1Q18_016569 [Sarracenia purpurea var. burkii]
MSKDLKYPSQDRGRTSTKEASKFYFSDLRSLKRGRRSKVSIKRRGRSGFAERERCGGGTRRSDTEKKRQWRCSDGESMLVPAALGEVTQRRRGGSSAIWKGFQLQFLATARVERHLNNETRVDWRSNVRLVSNSPAHGGDREMNKRKVSLGRDLTSELAQKELQKINMYKAPRDKLVCILNCCKVINNLLLNASIASNENPPGADEFLPVLIYVTLKVMAVELDGLAETDGGRDSCWLC